MYNSLKCPYCGSELTEQVDCYDESEKRICRSCDEEYIVWFDKNGQIEEITDRHNQKIGEAIS